MRIVCGSSLKSRQRPSGPHKAMARGIDGRLTVLLDKLEFELTNGGFGAEKDTAGGHAVEGRDRRGRGCPNVLVRSHVRIYYSAY